MAVYTTIDNPELYFQTVLYTGDGNNSRTITLPGSEDMQPDMIWIKERSSTSSHYLTSIGMGIGTRLEPDGTSAEATEGLSAVTSDGFTIGTSTNQVNQNTITHVAYCWKESADSGFDIISYAGNGSAARELSHSLSATPHFIIVKNRDDSVDWFVYHQGMSDDNNNKLNTTDAQFGGAYIYDPTSSIFKLRDHNVVNDSGDDYIAYAFAEKQGFSKFGSYTGNGNNDGAYVHTGFAPAFVLIKKSNASGTSWVIFDNKRNTFNERSKILQANDSGAEESSTNRIDFTASGFKLRGTWTVINNSGDTYIYMAFADAPFVNSNGVPCNAR